MAVVLRGVWEGATALCLVAGAFFALVGAIGLVRLPDTFIRFHAATKATTLGVGGVLTAPVSALMLARARPSSSK